ncbi:TlpA family protein disulfide reductase [Deefgea salmonis]|uniref:TlpA family protein disulfide reductase n=1 Tax=Deefgea salmonis TaxID=2875502 RepID=A0ABS8BIQ4_9NEIS|nr:TlpA disulfide reductase family protein [Deefgea salmonis]MCB5195466.1 TlpA family protein disulfide reductase [Deefgea salmonis]
MKKALIALLLLHATSFAANDLANIQLNDLAGQPQALSQWQGRPLVINYWATWCGPCRQEIPDLIELQKKYQGKVQLIGIAIDDAAAVNAFIRPLNVNYPILIGGNSAMEMMRRQGNLHAGLPFTVIFDARGQKIAVQLGRIKKEQLDRVLSSFSQPASISKVY